MRTGLLALALAIGWLTVASALGADASVNPALADRDGFDLARPEIAAFIDRCVREDGLSRRRVRATLAAARARPELIEAMEHPAETVLPWWQYRQRFVSPQRILVGIQFWIAHKELLDEVSSEQGVPPEYLVAILGIETRYGLSTGSYREIDTLMTLAFDYPSRGRFFRDQLHEYLLLAREQHLDPIATQGSYGGALGTLQFMPSNYRRFAVSAPGRTRAQLWTDWHAIFASEANFLRAHGWQPGEQVLLPAALASGSTLTASGGIAPDSTLGALRAQGLRLQAVLPDETRVVLIGVPEQSGIDYAVGLRNFYVITRYNPSLNYALAVDDLAQRLRSAALGSPVPLASP